jgi:hypothetical protein
MPAPEILEVAAPIEPAVAPTEVPPLEFVNACQIATTGTLRPVPRATRESIRQAPQAERRRLRLPRPRQADHTPARLQASLRQRGLGPGKPYRWIRPRANAYMVAFAMTSTMDKTTAKKLNG